MITPGEVHMNTPALSRAALITVLMDIPQMEGVAGLTYDGLADVILAGLEDGSIRELLNVVAGGLAAERSRFPVRAATGLRLTLQPMAVMALRRQVTERAGLSLPDPERLDTLFGVPITEASEPGYGYTLTDGHTRRVVASGEVLGWRS
jgi:hypothetical protein